LPFNELLFYVCTKMLAWRRMWDSGFGVGFWEGTIHGRAEKEEGTGFLEVDRGHEIPLSVFAFVRRFLTTAPVCREGDGNAVFVHHVP